MSENMLENYNPLYDVHLRQYFALPHMQKHLKDLGLLESKLDINAATQDPLRARHRQMMDQMLRNREHVLQQIAELQKKLDAAEKVELYRRIRSGMTNLEELDRSHISRSLSRPSRSAKSVGGRSRRRQRRHSGNVDASEMIKRVEENYQSDTGTMKNSHNIYKRLAASVYKYQYLHKLDDRTLYNYIISLRRSLKKLERFREVTFGPHTMARHQPEHFQESWYFRRRSSFPTINGNTSAGAAGSVPASTTNPNLHRRSRHDSSNQKTSRSGKSQSPCRTRPSNDGPPLKYSRISASRPPPPSTQRLPPLPTLKKQPQKSVSGGQEQRAPSTAPKLPPTNINRNVRKPAPKQRQIVTSAPATKQLLTESSRKPPPKKPAKSTVLPAIAGGVLAGAAVAAAAAAAGGREEDQHPQAAEGEVMGHEEQRISASSPSVSLAASQTTEELGSKAGGDSEWEQEQTGDEAAAAGNTETRPTPEPFLEQPTSLPLLENEPAELNGDNEEQSEDLTTRIRRSVEMAEAPSMDTGEEHLEGLPEVQPTSTPPSSPEKLPFAAEEDVELPTVPVEEPQMETEVGYDENPEPVTTIISPAQDEDELPVAPEEHPFILQKATHDEERMPTALEQAAAASPAPSEELHERFVQHEEIEPEITSPEPIYLQEHEENAVERASLHQSSIGSSENLVTVEPENAEKAPEQELEHREEHIENVPNQTLESELEPEQKEEAIIQEQEQAPVETSHQSFETGSSPRSPVSDKPIGIEQIHNNEFGIFGDQNKDPLEADESPRSLNNGDIQKVASTPRQDADDMHYDEEQQDERRSDASDNEAMMSYGREGRRPTGLEAYEAEQIRRIVHPDLESERGPTESVRSLASSSSTSEKTKADGITTVDGGGGGGENEDDDQNEEFTHYTPQQEHEEHTVPIEPDGKEELTSLGGKTVAIEGEFGEPVKEGVEIEQEQQPKTEIDLNNEINNNNSGIAEALGESAPNSVRIEVTPSPDNRDEDGYLVESSLLPPTPEPAKNEELHETGEATPESLRRDSESSSVIINEDASEHANQVESGTGSADDIVCTDDVCSLNRSAPPTAQSHEKLEPADEHEDEEHNNSARSDVRNLTTPLKWRETAEAADSPSERFGEQYYKGFDDEFYQHGHYNNDISLEPSQHAEIESPVQRQKFDERLVEARTTTSPADEAHSEQKEAKESDLIEFTPRSGRSVTSEAEPAAVHNVVESSIDAKHDEEPVQQHDHEQAVKTPEREEVLGFNDGKRRSVDDMAEHALSIEQEHHKRMHQYHDFENGGNFLAQPSIEITPASEHPDDEHQHLSADEEDQKEEESEKHSDGSASATESPRTDIQNGTVSMTNGDVVHEPHETNGVEAKINGDANQNGNVVGADAERKSSLLGHGKHFQSTDDDEEEEVDEFNRMTEVHHQKSRPPTIGESTVVGGGVGVGGGDHTMQTVYLLPSSDDEEELGKRTGSPV